MSGIQRGAGVSIESILIESIFDIDAQGEKEATYRRVAVSEFTHE
jgi:hypothetical protein